MLAPIVDIIAVTHEPMFVPRMKNNTSLPPEPIVSPPLTMAIIMDVVAELDWTSAVNTMPTKKSKNGLVIDSKNG